MTINPSEVTKLLKDQIKNFGEKAEISEIGKVLSVGDGIARVYGLDNVQAMIECSDKINIPVWLSVSCVIDEKTKNVMLGYNDSLDSSPEIYENFEISLNRFTKLHKGPILIAHSDISITEKALNIAKKNFSGILGAYPNTGHYEKPHWKFADNITPKDYLEYAKSWLKNGAQIIGGCCGLGVEEIKAISVLKE